MVKILILLGSLWTTTAIQDLLCNKLATNLQLVATEYIATGYAPLDPKAKKGMCYQGDPKITASGRPTQPNISIAAPKDIPFGTWMWIEGIGLRRVDDRGKAIKGNKIDICFHTKKEALQWGRRKVRVAWIVPSR